MHFFPARVTSRSVRSAFGALALLALPALAAAQLTISGRVMAGNQPVADASVGIPALKIETRTIGDGTFNLLVRAAQVQGQTVALVARHRQYGSATIQVVLAGDAIERTLYLTRAEPTRPPVSVNPPAAPRGGAPGPARPAGANAALASFGSFVVDSTALAAAAGPVDVAGSLAGRMPGLLVTGSTSGGSTLMVFRGPRTLIGSLQPLVVVDGVPIDASGARSLTQQFGLGGSDYGVPLQDLSLSDIASVTLVDPARAALRYGSRAANGVLEITTKEGGRVGGFSASPYFRVTGESPGSLPALQNRYGQGLDGAFEFFDGRGGGINDAVEESWGPEMRGQPILQASLTESGRPDVRAWAPHPSGARDYFRAGKTVDAGLALQTSGGNSSLRTSLGLRSASGLTPNSGSKRYGAALTGQWQGATRLHARGTLQLIRSSATDRPGTGIDESNPVSGFTRMGRQVDISALRSPIRDTIDQINWIYTARNNPFFQPFVNSNDDHRGHIISGLQLGYSAASWLETTLRAGTDVYHERRNLQIARGWRGGFPTFFDRGDFSGGGSQQWRQSHSDRFAELDASASTMARGNALAASVGVEARASEFELTELASDSALGVSRVTTNVFEAGHANVTSMYLFGAATRGDYLQINAGTRVEHDARPSPFSGGTAIFPSVSVAFDAARASTSLREQLGVTTAVLRASGWRAGNEVSPRAIATAYTGAGSAPVPRAGLAPDGLGRPERTNGIEGGVRLGFGENRVALDLTAYHENTTDVLLAWNSAAGPATTQQGELTNRGYQLSFAATPLPALADWNMTAWLARNRSTLDRLNGGVTELPLAPTRLGAQLLARVGGPLGEIVGTRFLRDAATNQIVVRNGLPIADATGPVSLGSWQPDWSAATEQRVRYRSFTASVLVEARFGGRIFSGTNRWGSYAGTLASTLVGRDTGLVIAAIDSMTGVANTVRVSAQDYFHALGAINEAFVYDASFAKLRAAQLSYELPLTLVPMFRQQRASLAIVGRNLWTWKKVPNIDPDAVLGLGAAQGFEMGQLPTTKSVGVQLIVTP